MATLPLFDQPVSDARVHENAAISLANDKKA